MAEIRSIYGNDLVDTTARSQIATLSTSLENLNTAVENIDLSEAGLSQEQVLTLIQTEINKLTLGVNLIDGLTYIFYGNTPLGTGISGSGDVTVGAVTNAKAINLNSLVPAGTYTVKYEDNNDTPLTNYDDICEITVE